MNAEIEKLITRLEAAVARAEVAMSGTASTVASTAKAVYSNVTGSPSASEDEMEALEKYDAALDAQTKAFLAASEKTGTADVAAHAKLLKVVLDLVRAYVGVAASTKKPQLSASDVSLIFGPLETSIQAVINFESAKENFRTKCPNHLKSVAEYAGACRWPMNTKELTGNTPKVFCKGMMESGDFYVNRAMTAHKNKVGEEAHVEWAKATKALFAALSDYVAKEHTLSLTWSFHGASLANEEIARKAAGIAAGMAGTGGVTALATEVAAQVASSVSQTVKTGASGMSSLFVQLSQGSGVTSGLKKVDASQMTHKNPSLRGEQGGVVTPTQKQPAAAAKPLIAKPAALPKLEQQGNKWCVENYTNDQSIEVKNPDKSHSVYIYNVKDSVVRVHKKVNNVVLDKCTKTILIVDDVISGIEAVNCKSIKIQINGVAPIVNFGGVDGALVYLTEHSLAGISVMTSKSSEVNVQIANTDKKTELDDDVIETPVPEQIKTVYDASKKAFVSTIFQHDA